MKKIVDMDECKKEIEKIANTSYFSIDASAEVATRIRDWINAQSNAEEVKHGKWIKPTMYKGRGWGVPHCSNCGEMPDKVTMYCAECGSKNGLKVWKKSELLEENKNNEICNNN